MPSERALKVSNTASKVLWLVRADGHMCALLTELPFHRSRTPRAFFCLFPWILEKGMATHSSILAWRMPWTEEPGGLQPMEPQRVRHDWAHTHVHMHVNMLQWLTECFKIFYSHLSAKCIGPLILWVTVTECISFTSVCCSTVWRNKIFKDIKADFRELLVVQWSLFPSFESNK